MANPRDKAAENVPGPYYNDTSCIDCDQCRELAPQLNAGCWLESRQHSKAIAKIIDAAIKRQGDRAATPRLTRRRFFIIKKDCHTVAPQDHHHRLFFIARSLPVERRARQSPYGGA